MAPKPTGMSQDEFLAACFRCAKEKITIDYDKLAAETGMSKGGAQNKYRAIMIKLGVTEGGVAGAPSAPSTPAGKGTTGAISSRKRKSPAKKPIDEDANDNEAVPSSGDDSDRKPIIKKIKASTTKKGTAKPIKKDGKKVSPVSLEAPVKEGDEEGEVEMAENGDQGDEVHGVD